MLDVGIYAVWGHRRVRCHLERGHAGQHRARFGSRYLDRHWPWVRRDDVWWGWSVVGHVVSVSTPDTVAPWPGSRITSCSCGIRTPGPRLPCWQAGSTDWRMSWQLLT